MPFSTVDRFTSSHPAGTSPEDTIAITDMNDQAAGQLREVQSMGRLQVGTYSAPIPPPVGPFTFHLDEDDRLAKLHP